MRRLGLLGVTASAATTLLATFAVRRRLRSAGQSGQQRRTGRDGQHLGARRARADQVPWPERDLLAAWAPAAKPRGGVLVIHENRGLTDHIRSVAGRFAAGGYSALALDLLSEEGGTGTFPDQAEVSAVLAAIAARALRRRHEGRP